MSHNFKIANGDTDSISFCKDTGETFSEEEQHILLEELNSLFPPSIHWEHDGIFERVLVLKSKNYVLLNNGKLKIKGSAIKAPLKEPALKEFIKIVLDSMLFERDNYKE